MNDLQRGIVSVLCTMAEEEVGGSIPTRTVYMAMECNLSQMEIIINALVSDGLATHENHVLTITEKGKSVADEIVEAVKEYQQEQEAPQVEVSENLVGTDPTLDSILTGGA